MLYLKKKNTFLQQFVTGKQFVINNKKNCDESL